MRIARDMAIVTARSTNALVMKDGPVMVARFQIVLVLPIASIVVTVTVLPLLQCVNAVSQVGWVLHVTILVHTAYRSLWTAVTVTVIRDTLVLVATASVPTTARSWEQRASVSLDGVGRFVIILVVRGSV